MKDNVILVNVIELVFVLEEFRPDFDSIRRFSESFEEVLHTKHAHKQASDHKSAFHTQNTISKRHQTMISHRLPRPLDTVTVTRPPADDVIVRC